jgi:hypothetical protein
MQYCLIAGRIQLEHDSVAGCSASRRSAYRLPAESRIKPA